MFELEQYKTGAAASYGAITSSAVSTIKPATSAKPTNIFEPTALPDQQRNPNNLTGLASSNESMSAVDLNLTNIKETAAIQGTEAAKLQIQYNLLLKENSELRDKQEALLEDIRLHRVQLETERKANRDLKSEKSNFYSRRNQLEELFLNCVEETRKDIERRRAGTLATNANLNRSLHKQAGRKHNDSLE